MYRKSNRQAVNGALSLPLLLPRLLLHDCLPSVPFVALPLAPCRHPSRRRAHHEGRGPCARAGQNEPAAAPPLHLHCLRAAGQQALLAEGREEASGPNDGPAMWW
jgi:hypothetical protein